MHPPCFVIHHSETTERDSLVQVLKERLDTTVVPAVWIPHHIHGCLESHLNVARIAKQLGSGYIVFEDDCEILDFEPFLHFEPRDYDVYYFSITAYVPHDEPYQILHTTGSHTMYIGPRARDILLEHAYDFEKNRIRFHRGYTYNFDEIMCVLQYQYKMKVWSPLPGNIEKWARQKKGVTSTINGKLRK